MTFHSKIVVSDVAACCEICKVVLPVGHNALACDECRYYSSYLINFWIDVRAGMCELLTSADDSGNCQRRRFPVPKRYDRQALTMLVFAASVQFNSDYVSDDHVYNLVTNAIHSIHYGMRAYRIRKLRPKIKRETRT